MLRQPSWLGDEEGEIKVRPARESKTTLGVWGNRGGRALSLYDLGGYERSSSETREFLIQQQHDTIEDLTQRVSRLEQTGKILKEDRPDLEPTWVYEGRERGE